jgi:hypothetical protein
MANYRQLHCKMWSSDNWFINLNPAEKLLFIYLFSNESASMTGLYEIPVRIMSFETGLSRECVQDAIEVFTKADKIEYDFDSGVIWIKNMAKYQLQTNPNEHVRKRIEKDINTVPDCNLKKKYLLDTLSIPYQQGVDRVSIPLYSIVSSSIVSSSEGGVGGDESNGVEIPKSLDWMIAAGVSSEEIEKVLEGERLSKEITDLWEKSMGYNPLTWSKLERLRKFLITKTPEEIKAFAKWSRREYSTFAPARALQSPDKVIELWPQAFLGVPNKTDTRLERLNKA